MRQRKTVWVLGALALLALGALWWWASQRPPSIVIPPRQYPPNNAYDAYLQLAQAMEQLLRRDKRLEAIRLPLRSTLRSKPPVPEAEMRYYLQQMRPFLEAYRKHLTQPSAAVYEYDLKHLNPELFAFYDIARLEAMLIEDALEAGRATEAVQRLKDLMRFSEQVRADGLPVHYFIGNLMIHAGLLPLREQLTQLQSPELLEALLTIARAYEQQRASLKNVYQNSYYCGLGLYRKIAASRTALLEVLRDPITGQLLLSTSSVERWLLESGLGVPLLWRKSFQEYRQYHQKLFAELEKPLWQRKLVAPDYKGLINSVLFKPRVNFLPLEPDFLGRVEQEEVATIRLLACYATIKRYYQQRGAYPPSLEALRPELGEMIIDPFTGKPFVYRAHPKRGFQLYSVGENLTDDGGRLSANRQQGDLLPITEGALPEGQRPSPTRLFSPPVWLR
jgi:hypothetical protein